ncbi:MAG: hypothetical protein KTR32_39250 [Granulosicoccus sp.]|nr:hypothetical protein [Granulosicoccus sp.]
MLAAVAVVFPLVMLAAMFSAGAIGGAVTGRTARALGSGNIDEASSVLVCAVVISVIAGVLMWLLVIRFGPLLYPLATHRQVVLELAQHYASVLFPAMPAFWLVNMLCSVMRGSGDMVKPALVAATMLIGYSVFAYLFIHRADLDQESTIRAGAQAMVAAYLCALALTLYFISHKNQPVRFNLRAFRWSMLGNLLRQGLLASSQSLMTVAYASVTTILLGRLGTDWLAGYGLAVRLELIMVPVIFGMGAALIAIVGAYVGAGQRTKAIAIAWRGVLLNAAVIGLVGLFFALFPGSWCNALGSDANVMENCRQSLRVISPTYLFFALGLGCYFASQGLNTLAFPVIGALIRLLLVISGLFWINQTTNPAHALLLIACAVVCYGLIVVAGLKFGPWRHGKESD